MGSEVLCAHRTAVATRVVATKAMVILTICMTNTTTAHMPTVRAITTITAVTVIVITTTVATTLATAARTGLTAAVKAEVAMTTTRTMAHWGQRSMPQGTETTAKWTFACTTTMA